MLITYATIKNKNIAKCSTADNKFFSKCQRKTSQSTGNVSDYRGGEIL
ncbi:hypothetical protein SPONN_528 [uncultured Candidatus Thioglobus sp.]|nr:hypothetical protein SPONN_528 [uncultured Candidatus Thioglobus sp.]